MELKKVQVVSHWKAVAFTGREQAYKELIQRLQLQLAEKERKIDEQAGILRVLEEQKKRQEDFRLEQLKISTNLKQLVKGDRTTWPTTKVQLRNPFHYDIYIAVNNSKKEIIPGQSTAKLPLSKKDLQAAETAGSLTIGIHRRTREGPDAVRTKIPLPPITIPIVKFGELVDVKQDGSAWVVSVNNSNALLRGIRLKTGDNCQLTNHEEKEYHDLADGINLYEVKQNRSSSKCLLKATSTLQPDFYFSCKVKN